jgi:hypothetical protein
MGGNPGSDIGLDRSPEGTRRRRDKGNYNLCSLLQFLAADCFVYFSVLKMEVVHSPETSVYLH